jgi:hypothetical protein
MFEDLGLTPYSNEELKSKVLERYGSSLGYIKDNKKEFLRLSALPIEERGEDYVNFDLSFTDKNDSILPLDRAYGGFLDYLKCEMIGGDTTLVPLSERAIKSAMEHPELQVVAKDIVRKIKTPDRAWREVVEDISREFELSKTIPSGRFAENFGYVKTVFATGKKENKTDYLSKLAANWRDGYYSKLDWLTTQVKALGKIPLGALSELEDLEYRKWVNEKLKAGIERRTRVGMIPFYYTQAIAIMEDNKQGYRFRNYGRAVPLVKDIADRTISSGLKVQEIEEEHIKPILAQRSFSLVRI